jgi:hypothetical protein
VQRRPTNASSGLHTAFRVRQSALSEGSVHRASRAKHCHLKGKRHGNHRLRRHQPRTAAYAAKELLKRGLPFLVIEKFGQAKSLPANNSKTIKFRRYSALPNTPVR